MCGLGTHIVQYTVVGSSSSTSSLDEWKNIFRFLSYILNLKEMAFVLIIYEEFSAGGLLKESMSE